MSAVVVAVAGVARLASSRVCDGQEDDGWERCGVAKRCHGVARGYSRWTAFASQNYFVRHRRAARQT